ncbi:hypothetical protein MKW98_000854 [Papaver atlanticum]|uniref:RNase H type-1 domain-containing protein n=1 Tax=Papaver atlanticum TaxID=357466 RepID=A0AAD4SFB1_9MAGN|nr:hypothetical protein MKW98_000854 [Papaver atlanticum]
MNSRFPGIAGAGVVARDANCSVLGAMCIGLRVTSNYLAELYGILVGLEWAIRWGFGRICDGDTLRLVVARQPVQPQTASGTTSGEANANTNGHVLGTVNLGDQRGDGVPDVTCPMLLIRPLKMLKLKEHVEMASCKCPFTSNVKYG